MFVYICRLILQLLHVGLPVISENVGYWKTVCLESNVAIGTLCLESNVAIGTLCAGLIIGLEKELGPLIEELRQVVEVA